MLKQLAPRADAPRFSLTRLVLVTGLLAAALLLSGVSVLAYQGSSGASVTTCDTRVQPGGSTCVSATFTTNGQPNAGDSVTFSSDRGGGSGCTVTFNPATAPADTNGQAGSTATFGSDCRGNVQVCATDTKTGQSACASVIVNSGNGNGGGGNGNAGGNGSGPHSAVQGASTNGGNGAASGQTGTTGGRPGGGSPRGAGHSDATGTFPTAAVAGGSAAGLLVIGGLIVGFLRRRRAVPAPA